MKNTQTLSLESRKAKTFSKVYDALKQLKELVEETHIGLAAGDRWLDDGLMCMETEINCCKQTAQMEGK